MVSYYNQEPGHTVRFFFINFHSLVDYIALS